jgi:hypothetical protein
MRAMPSKENCGGLGGSRGLFGVSVYVSYLAHLLLIPSNDGILLDPDSDKDI